MKIINKGIKIILIIFAIFIIGFTNRTVSADSNDFPDKIGPFYKSYYAKPPSGFDASAGQTLKYDPNNKFIVFCSQYHSSFYASGTCKNEDEWSEAIQAGVAKIIEKSNIQNNPITSGDQNVSNELLEKNLQVSLAINALLYDKLGEKNLYWISGTYNPEDYLNDDFKGYLSDAKNEYDRVNGKHSVQITRKGTHIYHIQNNRTDSDKFEVNFEVSSGTLPTNVKLKLSFSNNETFDNNAHTIVVTNTNKISIDLNNTTITKKDDYYMKVELIDERTDTSNGISVKYHIDVTGELNYKLAQNYNCGVGNQKLVPNKTIDKKIPYRTYKNGSFKQQGELDYPTLKIIKIEKDNPNKTIEDARFKIVKKGNNDGDESNSEISQTIYTDDSGEINIDDLEDGEYCVTETKAGSGYKLDKTEHCFTIEKVVNGFNVDTNNDDAIGYYPADSLITITLGNEKNTIRINKYDEEDHPVAGVTLKIEKVGVADNDWNLPNNESKEWVTTEEAREIIGLEKGQYQIREIRTKEGYVLNQVPVLFNVTGYEDAVRKVYFYNKKTVLNISKVDIVSKQEIEGAHLRILDGDCKEVVKLNNENLEWISGTTTHTIIGLPAGNYCLEETLSPKGYKLKPEKIKFTMDELGNVSTEGEETEDSTIIMTNEYNKVYISKQDITTKKELPGAHLTVTDENGNIVDGGDWISTEEPHLLEALAPGTYTITEITSPDGYTKNEESITFTVDKNGAISGNTVMYNTPTPDVPSTLSTQSIIIIVLGTILVCTGVGFYFYGIKKKNQN